MGLAVSNIQGAIAGLTVPASGTGSLAISGHAYGRRDGDLHRHGHRLPGRHGDANYSITVNPAVSLSPATLPSGAVNVAYTQTITASGGTGTVTLVVSNSLMTIAGLTVPASGTGSLTITGTPTAAGTRNVHRHGHRLRWRRRRAPTTASWWNRRR